MKPWSEYEGIISRPSKESYLKPLLDEIHNTKLTTQEREDAILEAKRKAADWYLEEVKRVSREAVERANSFWRDCRAEIGYDKFLTEEGVRVVEDSALQNSKDLEDTYNLLRGYFNEQDKKGQ